MRAFIFFILLNLPFFPIRAENGKLSGRILESEKGPVAARLYIESLDDRGRFYHANSASEEGKAVPYERKRGVKSVEIHTCLSAHPFEVDLPPGPYRLTVERGHEYLTQTGEVTVEEGKTVEVELTIERWIDMAKRGWFSGDTHCHRTVAELETVLPAEDLNVGLPLTAWVTDSEHTPAKNTRNREPVPAPELIRLGERYVIWPINTEYEIFTVKGQRHVLGAVFVLNHRETLELKVPPVKSVAEEARRQGAVLDLDKHNWPWSMSIVPVMNVNLFELTNNHVWRTEFAFTTWYTEYVGDYMKIPLRLQNAGDRKHILEDGWLDFGFQTYYALLNCGLRILPSGGTASGVHPVPLGFGRVYAQMPESGKSPFTYEKWIEALEEGRTFVTTGPMLFVTVGGKQGGTKLVWKEGNHVPVSIQVESRHPIEKLELIVNGEVLPVDAEVESNPDSSSAPYLAEATPSTKIDRSSWIAVRVFTKTPDGRPRFAHSAPVWLDVEGKPLRPRVEEAEYLAGRVKTEIDRHREILSEDALREMSEARDFFEGKKKKALGGE